jgi:hypothetical protein
MSGDWVTWALQALLILGIGRVWLAIDKNTESLSNLREELPKTYVDKLAFEKLETYAHDNVHDLKEKVHGLELADARRGGQET